MTILKFSLLLVVALSFSGMVKADEPTKNETLTLSRSTKGTEHLSGIIGHTGHHQKGKKAAASSELVIHVSEHHGKKPTDAGAKHGKTVKLTASGDILAKLNSFAEKHAHVKVSGTISGDTMTVTEVSETKHKAK